MNCKLFRYGDSPLGYDFNHGHIGLDSMNIHNIGMYLFIRQEKNVVHIFESLFQKVLQNLAYFMALKLI